MLDIYNNNIMIKVKLSVEPTLNHFKHYQKPHEQAKFI